MLNHHSIFNHSITEFNWVAYNYLIPLLKLHEQICLLNATQLCGICLHKVKVNRLFFECTPPWSFKAFTSLLLRINGSECVSNVTWLQ